MITAVVGIVHSFELWPHYLGHYRALGVERFVVLCDPADLDRSGALLRAVESEPDVRLEALPAGFRRSKLVGMIEEEGRRRLADAKDWWIPADLDELNQYPDDLRAIVRAMDREGCTHLVGRLSDRLAVDGTLAPLRPFTAQSTIWDQYPLEADVTERLTRGRVEKVLLSRGDLSWTMGHHTMRDSAGLRPFGGAGTAHHFKWRDGLRRSLAWRVEHEQKARVPWAKESARLLEYLERHGGIRLEDVGARRGWRPRERPLTGAAAI